MAECIIARGGKSSEQDSAPIIQNRHAILATLKTTRGDIVPDCLVKCKDGNTWYNYHTNAKGQVLFVTNSGSAHIGVYNYSETQRWQILDQGYNDYDVDAPVGFSTTMDITFNNNMGSTFFNQMGGTFGGGLFWRAHNENYKVIAHNQVFVMAVGGGGSGQQGLYDGAGNFYGGGGGGGGGAVSGVVNVNSTDTFKLYIGEAGIFNNNAMNVGGRWTNYLSGTSGGTTTAFGFVATGGAGGGAAGSVYGGVGGNGSAPVNAVSIQTLFGGNGGNGWSNNNYSLTGTKGQDATGNFTVVKAGGGGGGGGRSTFSSATAKHAGGSPGGGNGGYGSHGATGSEYFPQAGKNWGSGGGGGLEMPYVGGFGANGNSGYLMLQFQD